MIMDLEVQDARKLNYHLLDDSGVERYKLSEEFIQKYINRKEPFKNEMGKLIYMRTYSRLVNDKKEKWYQTCRRVIEGTITILIRHLIHNGLPIMKDIDNTAESMYDGLFNLRWSPAGRGLWAMGTDIIYKRGLFAALNNCGFISTKNISINPAEPFTFLMDMLMLGVGVGFDTKGAETIKINELNPDEKTYVIPDSREGWVESLRLLIESRLGDLGHEVYYDYSEIRKKGLPIKTFGGISSGAKPLKLLHNQIRDILNYDNAGRYLTVTNIVDIMNLIGVCVVSGNVRRSAEIALGDNTKEFLDLKNYEVNPHRANFGWSSNNSIFNTIGMDYSEPVKRTLINGEIGYINLELAKSYGRLVDDVISKDTLIEGVNPCGEQFLEHGELCNVAEQFIINWDLTNNEQIAKDINSVFLYTKIVSLGKIHNPISRVVQGRNKRIGISMTSITDFLYKYDIETLRKLYDSSYKYIRQCDYVVSKMLHITESIKHTTIKPSGTLSNMAGVSCGIHFKYAKYYIRRVNLSKQSEYINIYKEAGYNVVDNIYDENSVVIEFPIHEQIGRKNTDVSMWEKLELAAFTQNWWSDNSVSITVDFDRETEGEHLEKALDLYQYRLKSVSFQPYNEHGFEQAPYEEITKEEYEELIKNIKDINYNQVDINTDATVEKYCTNDSCEI